MSTQNGPSTTGKETALAKQAKQASLVLGALSLTQRNEALQTIHSTLLSKHQEILDANKLDMQAAEELVARGVLQGSMVKRLDLGLPGKFESMCQGVLDVMKLPDPLGRVSYATKMDEGLELRRMSCALGVLLVIFEARPEVVVNITALALKSGIQPGGALANVGNAAILKGGKESIHTSSLLARIISDALKETAIPSESIAYLTSREQVTALLSLTDSIDLVIPRGSNALVSSIQSSTKIPVMGHADGRCCAYVHSDANITMARDVILDSKIDYPAACNALETLLVHESLVKDGRIKDIVAGLVEKGVELRCENDVLIALKGTKGAIRATDEDIVTEFLDLRIYIRSVNSLDEAINHINTYSSHHTDTILTTSPEIAEQFQRRVDSAGVYWNASTRFADGFRYGFGAEVGVSTGKLHARGPVGLEGLTSYKYLIDGNGQGVGMYSEKSGRKFLHQRSI